ncbi:MAG: FlgO family outer membrane protein [bacterium]|nr:FlgO family outer membrane protein [bacterium]
MDHGPSLFRRNCFRNLFLSLVLACSGPVIAVHAEESQVAAQIKQFAGSIITKLETKAQPNTPIAIADFDNQSEEAVKANLGFAVSEIITEQFEKSRRFRLVEKKQISRIIQSMEMNLTGLYDSDKVSSIGKLINARFLIVGSVSKLAGFYRVAVRIVEVATSTILLSDSIDLDSELLEDTAKKYQPPRYRLHIGSSMSWFGMNEQGGAIYSIGFSMGAHYHLSGPHWLTLQGILFFDHLYLNNSKVDDPVETSVNVQYSLKNALLLLGGYGYRFKLSRAVSIQPNLFIGWITSHINIWEYYHENPDVDIYNKEPESYQSGILQPRIDLVFLEKNPISFYIGAGYYHYLKKFSRSFYNLNTARILNGIKLEGAIMFFF